MPHALPRNTIIQALIAIVGAGAAFAFLEAGAFTDLSFRTLQRMVAPAGLRSAALGAGVTALLLLPALAWQRTRSRRGSA